MIKIVDGKDKGKDEKGDVPANQLVNFQILWFNTGASAAFWVLESGWKDLGRGQSLGGGYFTNAGVFLVNALFGIYIFLVMLRFFLQLVRADFYNPLSQMFYLNKIQI